MAPFNKRQIGYIKAIADVGGHATYLHKTLNHSNDLDKLDSAVTHDGRGKYAFVTIGATPRVYSAGAGDTLAVLSGTGIHSIDVYNVPVNLDQTDVSEAERVTPECYLESVHARMRLIQNLDSTTDANSHQEYRMLVFRHKERQARDVRFAENHSNPLYDMFLACNNYKVGPLGYRKKAILNAGSNDYVANSSERNDVQSLMTSMTNKEDYVFMKDVRFYLGKDYGGKHIYEDALHWDHADPIATESAELTYNDSNNKNYTWYIALFCTHNQPSGAADFPYVRFDTTTHVTSG